MESKKSSLEWLDSLDIHSIKLGLENITELLKRLGNPQNSFKTIHVAGTDGKGSTCAMIASILEHSGVRTGLYTSPHIMEFNERIRISGEQISDDDLYVMVTVIRPIVEDMKKGGMECTFFEVTTALAFLYFKENDVDYAVVEVGMGGRFDATNVIVPEITVITKISLEHTEYLGDTVEKIAGEKAGIIKEGVPVVTVNEGPAYDVIFRKASETNSWLVKVVEPQSVTTDGKKTMFTYKGREYTVGIPGKYQALNACTAIEAVMNIPQSERFALHITEGLKGAKWPCRMQKMDDLPIIIDVTHTKVGSEALADDISEIYGKVTVVFGVLSDKDVDGIAENLSKIASRIIVTAPISERSADPTVVEKIIKNHIRDVMVVPSVFDAFDLAMKVHREDNILVTGSFIMAEDALKWLRKTSAGF